MNGNDILARVRQAIHMADSLQIQDAALAEQLIRATERCRDANRELVTVLEQLKPGNAAGEAARAELLQQLHDLDCGDKLLRTMIDPHAAHQAEIHTQLPPSQVQ